MTIKTIKACEVQVGQTITSISSLTEGAQLRSIDGQWPTVQATKYKAHNYFGEPVVYLTVSGNPELKYLVRPDDDVTIEVPS